MSSDSSSSDDDAAKFAAVAVSAQDLQQHAERSKQVAQQREARARKRRAGGGGVLGALPADGSEGEEEAESGFLDAAQIKVAEALQRRLQKELEEVPAAAPAVPAPAGTVPPPTPQAPAGSNGDDSGEPVRLFSRVKAGAPVLDRQQQQQGANQGPNGNQQQAGGPGTGLGGPAAARRCLEEPTHKRCKAAAVEAAAIECAAAAAAQHAAANIAEPPGWLPAKDDPSRWSRRRKRRAAKLEAEAAGWLQKRRLQQGLSVG